MSRAAFEEWARDAAGLDIRHADSESPLDRQHYESRDTALAWEAWNAAMYEAHRTSAAGTPTDTARLDWLECHPREGSIRLSDGSFQMANFWAVSAHKSVTLRQAIDAARAIGVRSTEPEGLGPKGAERGPAGTRPEDRT